MTQSFNISLGFYIERDMRGGIRLTYEVPSTNLRLFWSLSIDQTLHLQELITILMRGVD